MGGHLPSEKKNANGKKNGKKNGNGKKSKSKMQTPEDPKTGRPRGEPSSKKAPKVR